MSRAGACPCCGEQECDCVACDCGRLYHWGDVAGPRFSCSEPCPHGDDCERTDCDACDGVASE